MNKQYIMGGILCIPVPENTKEVVVRATIHCDYGSVSFFDKFTNKEWAIKIPKGLWSISSLNKNWLNLI